MSKPTALAEVVEAAERHGWIVKLHPVTRLVTHSARDGARTAHDDIVAEIAPSEAMKNADRYGSGYGTATTVIALFRQSGAFHTAFKAGIDFESVERRAETVAEEQVKWHRERGDHPDHIERSKANAKGAARYNIISANRLALTKWKLLDLIENNALVIAERRKANEAQREAERLAKEIDRLRQVEANNSRLALEATQEALEALEKVKADLRACHPTLAGAPGLVDSIIFALVGESNDPEAHALIQFVQARGRIETHTAERDKAQAFLASQGVTV